MAESRKTIWMINPAAIPPSMPGGTRHFDFARELVHRGYRVRILASDFNLNTRRRYRLRFGQLFQRQSIDGVEFVWLNVIGYKRNNWRRIANFLSFMVSAILVGLVLRRPSIIIGSSPHPFSALAGLILAKLRRARFILEVRDLWPETLIEGGSMRADSVNARLLRRLERLLYRHAIRIIVLAKGSVDYIVQMGFDRDRVIFIPNGVHMKYFLTSRTREEMRRELHAESRFVVMYCGAHGKLNALDTIIDAAELTREDGGLLYVLVGDGVEKRRLMTSASERRLTNIRFLDPVPKQEIPDLLHAADALVITLLDVPLFQYGVSPNKLFDYMAAGRPVLCAVAGDMAELVETAGAGIAVPPQNPQELVDAIARIRSQPELAAQWASNGKQFIRENFDREILVERLLEAIDA